MKEALWHTWRGTWVSLRNWDHISLWKTILRLVACDPSRCQEYTFWVKQILGAFPQDWEMVMENWVMEITQNCFMEKESGLKTLQQHIWYSEANLQCAMFAVIHYKTLILLGINIIPQNMNSISSLVSRCCLVDSHLFSSLPFSSLSSSSGGRAGFPLPEWAGYIAAWLCVCRVLCHAASSSQLSQTLHSFSSAFPLLFSLPLPDSASHFQQKPFVVGAQP